MVVSLNVDIAAVESNEVACVIEYFHRKLLYTSTELHFTVKYFAFNWSTFSHVLHLQILIDKKYKLNK